MSVIVVDDDDSSIASLMIQPTGDHLGIAAPQIGINKRMMIVNGGADQTVEVAPSDEAVLLLAHGLHPSKVSGPRPTQARAERPRCCGFQVHLQV